MAELSSKIGLALTGGGARAAYQIGVLKGISEILGKSRTQSIFHSISGISAGAINAAFLASEARDFNDAIDAGYELWVHLKAENVIRTDTISFSKLAFQWIRNIAFGGIFGTKSATFLLNSDPLRELLGSQIDFDEISTNIQKGYLGGVAVTATNYRTGTAITFFDGGPEIQPWVRSSRLGRRERIGLEHVLASAAIPILFRPVLIKDCFYGDGSVRLKAPLSPAVHLGADRILAIGIRYVRPEGLTLEINEPTSKSQITLAEIAGTMLNAAFMDSLDSDVERLERINQTISMISEEQRILHKLALRPIPLLVIRPSRDLGSLAAEHFYQFPKVLRYLLRGIGASERKGWDLLSYLAFDSSYTSKLLELGQSDAKNQAKRILEFCDAQTFLKAG